MEQVRIDTFFAACSQQQRDFSIENKLQNICNRLRPFYSVLECGIHTTIAFFFPDSFVNSQEWTLSRGVPDIRLGIVGSLSSGKSALVHRYLTGSYMQEESPEGGRFKKEVVVDGHSYLLLIRDEGGPPELQVSE